MLFDTITIVGVGLIGGSVGRAVKARGVARRVIGLGRNREFLQLAVELGALDAFATDANDTRDSDLTVVCVPVDQIATIAIEGESFRKPGAIVTDVGSTKANIVDALAGRLKKQIYVGSHPLAGSEKAGVEHSRADLFEGKATVVVPGEAPENAVQKVEAFWRALGSRTFRMSAAEHDRAMAFTSHLPHGIAAALARVLPADWLPLAASGFKDTTRIAAGEPVLWDAIFNANRAAVLDALAAFRASLDEFERRLVAKDSLTRWLDEGKQVRDALGS